MNTEIKRISIYIKGIKKRCRKVDSHFIFLKELSLAHSESVSPEQFIDLEREAWQKVDAEGYKVPSNTLEIRVQNAWDMGNSGITRVELLPKQKYICMR